MKTIKFSLTEANDNDNNNPPSKPSRPPPNSQMSEENC